jgi:hypothetical protein
MTDEEKNRPVTQRELAGTMKQFVDLHIRVMALQRLLEACGVFRNDQIESYVAYYYQHPEMKKRYRELQEASEQESPQDKLLELLKKYDGPIQ